MEVLSIAGNIIELVDFWWMFQPKKLMTPALRPFSAASFLFFRIMPQDERKDHVMVTSSSKIPVGCVRKFASNTNIIFWMWFFPIRTTGKKSSMKFAYFCWDTARFFRLRRPVVWPRRGFQADKILDDLYPSANKPMQNHQFDPLVN